MAYLQLLSEPKVAVRMGTKPQTIRNQIASIRRKFNAGSSEQLIAICLCTPGALENLWRS
jgi:DNA-binding CsgD family transcriptional regulator